MTNEFEKKWEKAQMNGWKDGSTISTLFYRFDVDIAETYSALCLLRYERQQSAMYLLGKIQKMMAICDFLDEFNVRNNEDVDKIKIFQLLSHAEIVMSTLSFGKNKVELVTKFFAPIANKLQYRLRLTIQHTNTLSKQNQDTSAANILYKLRNEYAHQGNFTGTIFLSGKKEAHVYNGFVFDWDIPKKQKIVLVGGETNLTYNEFLNIYFTALKYHLSAYCEQQ